MRDANALAAVAAAIGQPSRAAMLLALGDGQPHNASALALAAGVLPPAASEHLDVLLTAGLVTVERAGRERLYRTATPEVARVLEALLVVAHATDPPAIPRGAIRFARTCYDHLAGKAGVAITEACVAQGHLRLGPDAFELTPSGCAFFASLGVDHESARRLRRGFARVCIDWSERRPHLAGALGAALATAALDRGWFERLPGTRALYLTPVGEAEVARALPGVWGER